MVKSIFHLEKAFLCREKVFRGVVYLDVFLREMFHPGTILSAFSQCNNTAPNSSCNFPSQFQSLSAPQNLRGCQMLSYCLRDLFQLNTWLMQLLEGCNWRDSQPTDSLEVIVVIAELQSNNIMLPQLPLKKSWTSLLGCRWAEKENTCVAFSLSQRFRIMQLHLETLSGGTKRRHSLYNRSKFDLSLPLCTLCFVFCGFWYFENHLTPCNFLQIWNSCTKLFNY